MGPLGLVSHLESLVPMPVKIWWSLVVHNCQQVWLVPSRARSMNMGDECIVIPFVRRLSRSRYSITPRRRHQGRPGVSSLEHCYLFFRNLITKAQRVPSIPTCWGIPVRQVWRLAFSLVCETGSGACLIRFTSKQFCKVIILSLSPFSS